MALSTNLNQNIDGNLKFDINNDDDDGSEFDE